MNMTKAATRYDCGCIAKCTEGLPFDSYSIEYCPKHKAAPDMYEALVAIAKYLLPQDAKDSASRKLYLAINKVICKAEGKEV